MPEFDSNYTSEPEDPYAIFDNNGERTNFFRIVQLWVKNNRDQWLFFIVLGIFWFFFLVAPSALHVLFVIINVGIFGFFFVVLGAKGYNKFMDWFTSL